MMTTKFLQGVFNPEVTEVGPPSDVSTASFVLVRELAATIDPTQYGGIIWNPKSDGFWALTPQGYSAVITAATSSLTIPVGFMLPKRFHAWAPVMGQNGALYRNITGKLSVKSNSTSTTSAALSGTFVANAISTLRGFTDYTDQSILMSGITAKDRVANLPVQDGLVMLQGPEIATDFQADGVTLATMNTRRRFTSNTLTVGATLRQVCWLVGEGLTATAPALGSVHLFPGVATGGDYSFDSFVSMNSVAAGVVQFAAFGHFWNPTTNTLRSQTLGGNSVVPAATAATVRNTMHINGHGYRGVGEVFVAISIEVSNASATDGFMQLDVYQEMDRNGSEDGPVRLCTWKDLAAGQSVTVTGTSAVQVVPTTTLAPWRNAAPSTSLNWSAFAALSNAFNDPGNMGARRTRAEVASGYVPQPALITATGDSEELRMAGLSTAFRLGSKIAKAASPWLETGAEALESFGFSGASRRPRSDF